VLKKVDLRRKKEDLREKDRRKKTNLKRKLALADVLVRKRKVELVRIKKASLVYVTLVNKADKLEMKSCGRNYDLQKMMC